MVDVSEVHAGGNGKIAPAIDVGKIIDDSRLNRVSIGVVVLCGLIMLMDGYDYGILSVADPIIMKEWNLGTALFGRVFPAACAGFFDFREAFYKMLPCGFKRIFADTAQSGICHPVACPKLQAGRCNLRLGTCVLKFVIPVTACCDRP